MLLSFFSVGCVSQSHRYENSPKKLENGNTQFEIKLHDNDSASVGTPINAYSLLCKFTGKKNREISCLRQLIGQGQVIAVASDKLSVVEFGPDANINSETLFEVASKDGIQY